MPNFPIDWGVHLPHLGRSVDRQSLLHFAHTLEQIGVDSGWVSDHVCWPLEIQPNYPYTDDGSFGPDPDMAWLDPLGTLLFLAGTTEKLRLGTTVLVLPYRPPVITAKQIATLDVLSNGRTILGVGVGWMAEEAKVLGMPWDQRGRRSDEQLALFDQLFTQDRPSFEGDFYQIPQVGFEPKPLQSPFPIWVGGSSPAAFRRVAQFGTGFHAAFQPLETVMDEWAQVRKFAELAQRDPSSLKLSLRIYLDPAGAMPADKSIAGSRQQMQDTAGELAQAGVAHVLLDPVARGGIQGRLDAVCEFMQNVA